ncbi:hypothetical protein T4D_11599 [Trichinella pseudospiralis]|uniref:Uncharacterized protein n=1 Tax=Trichinella pseudospiralis TaxID=6337 RepID=A0A0V1FIY8_TRIPS|nr:hypothetical protein T4D_11599 [Trichinella pseudospiralis]
MNICSLELSVVTVRSRSRYTVLLFPMRCCIKRMLMNNKIQQTPPLSIDVRASPESQWSRYD